MYDGFGDDDDGQNFEMDEYEPMATSFGFDENMNDITALNADIEFMPLQHDAVSSSLSTPQIAPQENRNEKTPSLLAELSSLSSSIVVRQKKKSLTGKRRTLLVDKEKEISTEFMSKRLSK